MMFRVSMAAALMIMATTLTYLKSTVADTIQIQGQASTELLAGQTVPISYEIHHNGIRKLMWIKLHLMTEDGQDAGPGVLAAMERSDWEESVSSGQKTFTTSFTVPSDIGTGTYLLHLFGETETLCVTSPPTICTGLLSDTLPVQIRTTRDSPFARDNNSIGAPVARPIASTHLSNSVTKVKRTLYIQPDDDYVRLNTKRFLHLISDQF